MSRGWAADDDEGSWGSIGSTGADYCPGPPGAFQAASAFSTVNRFSMGGFVWPRRARNNRKLWFPARAVRRSFEEFVDQHPFRRLVLAGNSRISRRAESLAREAARVFEGRRRATMGVDNPCEVAFKFPGGDSHGR